MEGLSFRLNEAGWGDLFARLDVTGFRGAIVGPKGSGKTTLLQELAERLRAKAIVAEVVLADSPDPVSSEEFDLTLARLRQDCDAFLLDGADRLPQRRWRQLEAAARTKRWLVITSHRPGRLPTVFNCDTTPTLLADLVRELLDQTQPHQTSTAGLAQPPTDEYLTRLHARCGGNVRSAFRHLYDCWASGEW